MKIVKRLCIFFLVTGLVACSSNTGEKDNNKNKGKDKMKDTVVSFTGVGDNLIHDTIYKDALKEDGTYDFKEMYSDVKNDIEKSDLAFINQETILGGEELGLSGYPVFNSPSEVAADLHTTGFDIVNLATNHSLDKGNEGIVNTLKTFSEYEDMVVNGVYTSEEAYQSIPTIKRKGITFSFLSYTYGTNGIEPPYAYSVSYFDDDKIREDVAQAKEISDVIIVSAHWGDENTFAANEFQTHYGQLFADLDVDVVIGTHPHTIQPIEWVEGQGGNKTLVVYSLGNFLGGMLTTDNAIGGMISFDFVKKNDSKEVIIENVLWTPLMIHFEGNKANIIEERDHYKVYKVKNYTKELADRHVLNGFEGNIVSLEYINEKTKEVIAKEYLK